MISLVKKSANALASVAGDSLEGYSLSGVLWSILFTVVNSTLYTAILRKVVGKMCTRQSRKVIWDMINTLFLTTVPVEPTFFAFL